MQIRSRTDPAILVLRPALGQRCGRGVGRFRHDAPTDDRRVTRQRGARDYHRRVTSLAWTRHHAAELIDQHLDRWSFDFDHARARVGCCHYADQRITLSRHLVPALTMAEVDQTLRHEIAHALAGQAAGHGPRWRSLAAKLGYTGRRTMDVPQAREQARWLARCPRGHEYRRHRRPSGKAYCRPCLDGGDWHALRWVDQRAEA